MEALVFAFKKGKVLVDSFSNSPNIEYIHVTIGDLWRWDRGHSACSGQPVAQEAGRSSRNLVFTNSCSALEYEYHTDMGEHDKLDLVKC